MRRCDREITDKEEILEIIEKADVCRLAFSIDNIPYIVAMNYGYEVTDHVTLYFHCANEGKKLDIIAKNNQVCLQVDIDRGFIRAEQACGWGMKYRSVVGLGRAEIIRDEKEKIKGLNILMKHYTGKNSFNYSEESLKETTVFKVIITELTGKKKN